MRPKSEKGNRAGGHIWHPAAATLLVALLALLSLSAQSARADFGFESVSLAFLEEDASPAIGAGSHPYAWTTSIAFNTNGSGSQELTEGDPKNLRIQLPPGLVGAPSLVPRCSHADYLGKGCPAASEVGTIALDSSLTEGESFPLYNLEPLSGNIAELGFKVQESLPMILALRVATAPPYNLVASIANAPQVASLFGLTLTIHGRPGGAPFLTLPRSCSPATTVIEAESWQEPSTWVSATAPEPLVPIGCEKLGFRPALTAQPTTSAARDPSGLDLDLDLPNDGLTSPTDTASADVAAATLALPAGMAINPAFAAGLGACSPGQLAAETPTSEPGTGCPQSAKVGSAVLTTPLLDGPVAGRIFVATPDDPATVTPGAKNLLDARYALYLVLRSDARGLLLTVPIRLEADDDGRLIASLDALPQLPFTHFELHLNGGPRAPLTTPACGTTAVTYGLEPSSGAAPTAGSHPVVTSSNCATPGFHPELSAGTTANAAGAAAPFVLDLAMGSREPNLTGVDLTLPAGLSAGLAAVRPCPEAVAGSAACPPSSRLGSARIAVGPGPEPLWIPEAGREPSAVYLAGPHQGAPYSLLIRVPAQAGPFDLGTVVLRAPVHIDPRTARVSLSVDGLPQNLAGVPIDYRHIRLLLDRAGFVRNPTSCEPTEISAAATSADGARSSFSSRFQATDCGALPFRPRLALRFSGGLARNGHPSLRAVLRQGGGEAGIAAAAFTLPAGELLDLRHLRSLCARRLPPQRCPAASRLGKARFWSPLAAAPLQGPIYLREPSHGLPDLLADLRSGGVHILLHGHTAAPRGRLRVRFGALPDVPLSKAVIDLDGGRRGILVNSESLCAWPRRADAVLSAHSGRRIIMRPAVKLPGC